MANLQSQAALEMAVLNAILQAGPMNGYPAYTKANAKRMFDGQPPPSGLGPVFVSVWYDGQRQADGRTKLDEQFGVYVTLTLRTSHLPYDQWVNARDEMEARLNAIRVLIHQDCWNYAISNAANALAGFRVSSNPTVTLPATVGLPVGFAEGLAFTGFSTVETKGPDWFSAEPPKQGGKIEVGIAQTARFAKARRVQAVTTAT